MKRLEALEKGGSSLLAAHASGQPRPIPTDPGSHAMLLEDTLRDHMEIL